MNCEEVHLKSRLLEVLAELRLSQREFSQLSGLSLMMINEYARGSVLMSLNTAFKISKILNVSIEDLFYEELTYHRRLGKGELSRYIKKTDQEFHIHYNTNILNDVKDSQITIQQGNGNNASHFKNNDSEYLRLIIGLIRENIDKLLLLEEDERSLRQSLLELESEIAKPQQQEETVTNILLTVKRILEGTAATVLGDYLKTLIKTQI